MQHKSLNYIHSKLWNINVFLGEAKKGSVTFHIDFNTSKLFTFLWSEAMGCEQQFPIKRRRGLRTLRTAVFIFS